MSRAWVANPGTCAGLCSIGAISGLQGLLEGLQGPRQTLILTTLLLTAFPCRRHCRQRQCCWVPVKKQTSHSCLQPCQKVTAAQRNDSMSILSTKLGRGACPTKLADFRFEHPTW